MQRKKTSLGLLGFTLLLAACGGGGSGGGDKGISTMEDATDVSKAFADVAKQALVGEAFDGPDVGIFSKPAASDTGFKTIIAPSIRKIVNEDVPPETVFGDCGGSSTTSGSVSYDDVNGYPVTADLQVSLDSYCQTLDELYSITLDGSVAVVVDLESELAGSTEAEVDYSYSTDAPGLPPSGSFRQSASCTFSNGVDNIDDDLDCTYTTYYQGTRGEYEATDIVVTGNNDSGYDISATVVDAQGNSFDAMFSGLTVCANGNIGSGSGTINFNQGSIDLEYISCDEMVITFQGNAETVAQ
ncbi:hypothetical protein [Halioxenophilus sp. WMMB6]|uniref:hypothetical protein n=1 Tax=Halioxenophilus sp. WMMB6 TaxID=3073815 RepID=UPI00295F411A|nr:hypothetical protein [Halioxenophilus sp. WMMB6]